MALLAPLVDRLSDQIAYLDIAADLLVLHS